MDAIFYEPPIETNYLGHILKEVYVDRVYGQLLDGKSGLTIVDVGANIGVTSNYFSQFASKVYSIEPSESHMKCLREMVRFNKNENITPIQVAIYSKDCELDFGHNQNKTMYSLHTAVWDKDLGTEKVRAVTLDTLFKEQKIDHVDFMKLDVEGSEHEILGSDTFDLVANKIDSILVEHHVWSNRNPNQLREALRTRGFRANYIPNDATLIYGTK